MESHPRMLYKFSRIVPEGVEVDEDIPVTFLDAFEGNRVRLGRGKPRCRKANEILCTSPSKHVSRTHCFLEFRNGDWFVIDFGSSNGTFVNMIKLETSNEDRKKLCYHKLNHKDMVALGVEGFDEDDNNRKYIFPVSEYYIFQYEKICIKNEKHAQSIIDAGLDQHSDGVFSRKLESDGSSDITSQTSGNTRERRESETTQCTDNDLEVFSVGKESTPVKSSKNSSSGSAFKKRSSSQAEVVTLDEFSENTTDVEQAVKHKKKKSGSTKKANSYYSADTRKPEQKSRSNLNLSSGVEFFRQRKSPKKKLSTRQVSESESESETRQYQRNDSKSKSKTHRTQIPTKQTISDDDSNSEFDDHKVLRNKASNVKTTLKKSARGRSPTTEEISESSERSDDSRNMRNTSKYSQTKKSQKSKHKVYQSEVSEDDSAKESVRKSKEKKKLRVEKKSKVKKPMRESDSDDPNSEESSNESDTNKAHKKKISTKSSFPATAKKSSPPNKSTSRKVRSDTESSAESDLGDFRTYSSNRKSSNHRRQAKSQSIDDFIVDDDYEEPRRRKRSKSKTGYNKTLKPANNRLDKSTNRDSNLMKKVKTRVIMLSTSEEESIEEEKIYPSKKRKESAVKDYGSESSNGKRNSPILQMNISKSKPSKLSRVWKAISPENTDDSDIEIAKQKRNNEPCYHRKQESQPHSSKTRESEPTRKRIGLAPSRHVVIQPVARTLNVSSSSNSSSLNSSADNDIPLWKLKEMEQQMRGRTLWVQLRQPFKYYQKGNTYNLEWSNAMKQQLSASAMDQIENQYLASRIMNAEILKTSKRKKPRRPRNIEPEFYYDRGAIRVKEPIDHNVESSSSSRPSTCKEAGTGRKRRSSEVDSDSSVASSVIALSSKSEKSSSSKMRRIEKPTKSIKEKIPETVINDSDSIPQEIDANIYYSETDELEGTNDHGGQSENNMDTLDDEDDVNAFQINPRTHRTTVRRAQLIPALPLMSRRGRGLVDSPRTPGLSRNQPVISIHKSSKEVIKEERARKLKEIAQRDNEGRALENAGTDIQILAPVGVRLTQNTRQDNLIREMQIKMQGPKKVV